MVVDVAHGNLGNGELGRTAWDAYVKAVGGTTHDGKQLPTWYQLGERQKRGWEEAAKAAVRHAAENG